MTGSLLVAHPNLHDPHFRRTILFLSHHSSEDGALGLVLNRPSRHAMNEAGAGALGRVPIYEGGPVGADEILLASLAWHENPGAVSFRGFGSASEDPDIPPEFRPSLRAFRGYAGWSKGQLEAEIAEKAWLLFAPSRPLIDMPQPDRAWIEIMKNLGPVYHLLAGMPDDPARN